MSGVCFVSGFAGTQLHGVAQGYQAARLSPRRGTIRVVSMSDDESKKGFFGKLKERIMRPIVTVPGGGGTGDLLECVFCSGSGKCDCDACKGSGRDARGTCLMCNGKTKLTCTVCNGFGAVDRIRRGGTDDRNTYFSKNKKKMQ